MIQRLKDFNVGTKILIPVIIMAIFGATVNVYDVISQMKGLAKQNSSTSLNMLADSIFISLKNAMNTGDTNIIKKVESESREKISGLKKLQIAKSEKMIKFFNLKQSATADKNILEVFKTKKDALIDETKNKKHTIRVLKAMRATKECLKCHTNEKEGDIIAVIDLTFNLDKSDSLISESLRNLTLVIFLLLIIALPIVYMIIKRGVVIPLNNFQEGLLDFFKYLNREEKNVKLLDHDSNDEIGIMTKVINENIEKTKTNIEKENKNNWTKEGISKLNKKLSGATDIVFVSNKAISFLCSYLKAGIGALYVYNEDEEILSLNGSYAFVQREDLSNNFKLGEGTVGQVALERSPIQIENIKRTQMSIVTGTTNEPPINTYTFPLIYQKTLFGVIEIGSTEIFNEAQREFFEQSNQIIATALFTVIQNTRVKELLTKSQKVNKKLKKQQKELEFKNTQMQEQQAQLEEANSQMQEQQAQLEEANSQMEEQQVQLKESEKELKTQNSQLLESKKELNLRAKDLENSNKYKSEFLANMSHELRTPLNSIILLSSMLKENRKHILSEDVVKKAKIINSSGEDLLRLINDVLDLSKVEAGKMNILVEDFSSKDFAEHIKDLFEPSAQKIGLKFIVEDKYSNTISNDKDKLSQIIKNFLSNSLKFTSEGEIKLIIESEKENNIKISVKDTGIGIPKEKQDLVFKAFQQADGSTSRKYGGTGLGLSITKELTGLLKGKIDLESEEGKGSVFSIIIPNLKKEKETPELPKKIPSKPIQNPQQKKQPQIIKEPEIIDDSKKIIETDKPFLIIEDDEGFALTLKSVINDNDDLVLIATTGSQGIKLAKNNNNIQGILLDLGLPDIDGVEVLKELKSNINTRKIPVYILSGRDNQSQTKIMGAVGFKQKPLSNDDLKIVFEDFVKFNDKKIKDLLIVENDSIQREAMIEFIGNKTIKSKGVDSIKEAIKELQKNIYDAVIVDLILHEGSGLEVCEYIKKNEVNIPIIVYTGKELTQKEENEIKKYTDSIIVKSINSQNRLLDEVDMFLHRAKAPAATKNCQNSSVNDISFDDKKILVVDDDMRNTYVLMEILEEKGAIVVTAENGKEAIEVLGDNLDTSIILMDIMMPVMNGYEATKLIKANDKTKDIPIIAVTAKAMNKDKEKCLEVGANDFLTKPLNLDTFVGVVKAWIK